MPDSSTRMNKPQGGKKLAGVDTKWWIIGGVLAGGAVWYSFHKSSAANATTATATDPSVDPSTGLPYSQEDYSYVPYGGYTGSSGSSIASGGTSTGVPQSAVLDDTGSPLGTTSNPFTLGGTVTTVTQPSETNGTWYTAAITALQQHGYTTAASTAAIGEYLLGMPLTNDQVAIVQAAQSLVGPPPTPIAVHTVSTPSTQGTGSVTQPAAPVSTAAPATPGLSLSNASGHAVHVQASKVAGAVLYEFYYNNSPHMAGPQNSYTSAPHPAGFNYGPVKVRAISATGKASGFSASQSIKVN